MTSQQAESEELRNSEFDAARVLQLCAGIVITGGVALTSVSAIVKNIIIKENTSFDWRSRSSIQNQ
jgi:hypothetical protein